MPQGVYERTDYHKQKISESMIGNTHGFQKGEHNNLEWKSGHIPWNKNNFRGEYRYLKAIGSDGICLFCGEIDPTLFEEHHPDKVKMPDFKITLCANCHRKLHWFYGINNYSKE